MRLKPLDEFRGLVERGGKFLMIPAEEISDKAEGKPVHMNATHPSIDRMWDIANTIRILNLNAAPLMGVATDDSHQYHGKPGAHVGRGWVQVRSRYLTPEHLIRAMKAGEFYASSGVVIDDVQFDIAQGALSVSIQSEADETYVTEFIASLKPSKSSIAPPSEGEEPSAKLLDPDLIGVVAAKVEGKKARYKLTGRELYVRAIITSSAEPVDPSWNGQRKQAWTQPVGWLKP